jgi:hypothetical protein
VDSSRLSEPLLQSPRRHSLASTIAALLASGRDGRCSGHAGLHKLVIRSLRIGYNCNPPEDDDSGGTPFEMLGIMFEGEIESVPLMSDRTVSDRSEPTMRRHLRSLAA